MSCQEASPNEGIGGRVRYRDDGAVFSIHRESAMRWFLKVLSQYADFSGRARRAEYWYFVLVCVLISIPLLVLDFMFELYSHAAGIGALSGLFLLFMLVPSVAVGVRRLHDTGRSGWWWLINLVPFIGPFIIIVLCIERGQSFVNRFGADPLAGSELPSA
jgi:uncharacterized membrane protein YhaH (DUF805 family)